MTLNERLEIFKEKGWSYDPINGNIISHMGKIINSKNNNSYILCLINQNKKLITVLGHHLAWYLTYNEVPTEIDHINQVRDDNRIENLRLLSHANNMLNKRGKGYYYNKRAKKWLSQIRINGKNTIIGEFNNEVEASECYRKAKQKYHSIGIV